MIGSKDKGNGISWIVRCLPYLEEQAIYDQFSQYAFAGDFRANRGLNNRTSVAALQAIRDSVIYQLHGVKCPTDYFSVELVRDQPDWSAPQSVTNYKGASETRSFKRVGIGSCSSGRPGRANQPRAIACNG